MLYSVIFIYFLRITLQKRRYKIVPRTIGCASSRAFHPYNQIRRNRLGLSVIQLYLGKVCTMLLKHVCEGRFPMFWSDRPTTPYWPLVIFFSDGIKLWIRGLLKNVTHSKILGTIGSKRCSSPREDNSLHTPKHVKKWDACKISCLIPLLSKRGLANKTTGTISTGL